MHSLSLEATSLIADPFAPEFDPIAVPVSNAFTSSPKEAPSIHLSSLAPAIIPYVGDYLYHSRRMSNATVTSADSEHSSAPLSHSSPHSSASDNSPRPAPQDDPAQAVQLPPIYSGLASDGRRGSLPSLSSSSGATYSASSLGAYQFPSADETAVAAPGGGIDRRSSLGLYDSSSGPLTGSSSSTAYAPSYDFSTSARHHPGASADYDQWTSSPPAGIARPSSTPSSLPYPFPAAHSSPPIAMYGSRIAGQPERRASYAQSATADHVKEEWGMNEYLGANPGAATSSASSTSNGASPSPNPSPSAQPPSLVDRPQKKRGKLPKPTTDFLKDWLHRHADHPYPSEEEKKQLCAATGLSMSQVSNWMINARRRILAPVHRSQSNPSTTQPLGMPRTSLPTSVPPSAGVSTATLLRRASMPTDGLQLFHPLSLQSLPSSHHGAATDPYYHPSRGVGMLYGPGSGRGPYTGGGGGGGYAASSYSFPGGAVSSTPQHQPYGATSSGLPMPYVPSQSHGSNALSLSTGAMYGQHGGQQGGYMGRGDQHSSPGSSSYSTPQ